MSSRAKQNHEAVISIIYLPPPSPSPSPKQLWRDAPPTLDQSARR